jgi:hypothetical protein
VKYLLARGADKNMKDKTGKTAIAWASERKFPEIESLLK